jgi:hypothetical protein
MFFDNATQSPCEKSNVLRREWRNQSLPVRHYRHFLPVVVSFVTSHTGGYCDKCERAMGYESNDGESCTCPICLEPLVQSILPSSTDGSTFIGTTVPCGHCLHVHCWDQWTATSISRLQSRSTPIHIKCPLCNIPTTSFVRLYLNLNTTSNSVLENDDDSMFDSDSEGDVRIEEKGTDDSTKESSLSASTKDNKEEGDGTSGGDVDLRSSRKYLKCKSTLRKLQYENKMLQSQYQEKNEHNQQLQSKVQTHEEKLRALQAKLDQLEQLQHSNQLSMNGISYEMVQLKREVQNLKNKLKEIEEQSNQKEKHMSELKQRYDQRFKDLQKKKDDIQEVQQILRERPLLVEEVRSLKEKLRRMHQHEQESFQRTMHAGKETLISARKVINSVTDKQRKRMLLAFREELEENENTGFSRKQKYTPEMQRIDGPTPLAPPVTSHAKTLVTDLLKKPRRTPSQKLHRKPLDSQFIHRSQNTARNEQSNLPHSENQTTSLFARKPPAVLPPLPDPPSVPHEIVPPPRSIEPFARAAEPRRKQATLLHFSKHFDIS